MIILKKNLLKTVSTDAKLRAVCISICFLYTRYNNFLFTNYIFLDMTYMSPISYVIFPDKSVRHRNFHFDAFYIFLTSFNLIWLAH